MNRNILLFMPPQPHGAISHQYSTRSLLGRGGYKKYKRDVSGYLQNIGIKGSEWRSMELIESRFPDIAEKYFDFTGKSEKVEYKTMVEN